MTLTVHIAESIRHVVKDIPKTVAVEKSGAITIHQLALNIGIPPVLIVFASVNGIKKSLNYIVANDAEIHFFGTLAGG